MLLRFSAKNFRSFQEEQELTLISSKADDEVHEARDAPALKAGVLPLAAVYGPNASGKSTLLKALRFMESAVLDSQTDWAPDGSIEVTPFALDAKSSRRPSEFEIDLLLEGVRYTYGFSVTRRRFVSEWLYAYPEGKIQRWIERDSSKETEFKFSRNLGGPNKAIADLTRPNSLYLSAAAQNNHPKLTSIFRWFARDLHIVFDRSPTSLGMYAAELFANDEVLAQGINELLKLADLGILEVTVKRQEIAGKAKDILVALASTDSELQKLVAKATPQIPEITFLHSAGEGAPPVKLPFRDESRGTQGLFALAPFIVGALAKGHTLCVDELDSSIHPVVVKQLISMFADKVANSKGAQLIFNTHDTNILACGLLRRDEIWFTEKSRGGATRLFPLSDYHPRSSENINRGYLQGRYGAIPFIGGAEAFVRQLDRSRKNDE